MSNRSALTLALLAVVAVVLLGTRAALTAVDATAADIMAEQLAQDGACDVIRIDTLTNRDLADTIDDYARQALDLSHGKLTVYVLACPSLAEVPPSK